MNDPYIRQFRARLRRIDRIHRQGGGFEAAGTLGQSYYTRMRRRAGRPVLRPALAILFALIAFKAVSVASLGGAEYDARLETLRNGHSGEQVVAFLMAPDPISLVVAASIAPYF